MSDIDFWKCTPRRLDALYRKHLEIHGEAEGDDSEEDGALAVMAW